MTSMSGSWSEVMASMSGLLLRRPRQLYVVILSWACVGGLPVGLEVYPVLRLVGVESALSVRGESGFVGWGGVGCVCDLRYHFAGIVVWEGEGVWGCRLRLFLLGLLFLVGGGGVVGGVGAGRWRVGGSLGVGDSVRGVARGGGVGGFWSGASGVVLVRRRLRTDVDWGGGRAGPGW